MIAQFLDNPLDADNGRGDGIPLPHEAWMLQHECLNEASLSRSTSRVINSTFPSVTGFRMVTNILNNHCSGRGVIPSKEDYLHGQGLCHTSNSQGLAKQ